MTSLFPPIRNPGLLLLALSLLSACAGGGNTRADAPAEATMATAGAAPGVPAAVPVESAVADGDAAAASSDTIALAHDPATVAQDAGMVAAEASAAADPDATVPPPYDPIADATLPAPAQMPVSYDPWEGWNRKVHRFNNAVDRTVAKPLAKAYVATVPRPMRLGVSNFFNNLRQPLSALNALLQGKPKQAGQALGRFVVNSTLGIGGIFDPASDAKIPYRNEDFGQTLGVWGWETSRYVELPLFGPRTLRDSFGLVGDAPLSPIRQVENDATRYFLQGLQLVDVRSQLFAVDGMREGATDDYALVRDAWLQRRSYQIHGERKAAADNLPDYMLEDSADPTVPVDVMPVVPLSPTP